MKRELVKLFILNNNNNKSYSHEDIFCSSLFNFASVNGKAYR